MAEMERTAEELRAFPLKDEWTGDESLALIEDVDGTECIHGVPVPPDVQTRPDKIRWASCVRIAAMSTGDPVESQLVQQTARMMYEDRATYVLGEGQV